MENLNDVKPPRPTSPGALRRPTFRDIIASPVAREALVIIAWLALTALMTWPWVTRLRDAVADVGDPYMIAWTLWWNYHQTFHDPVNLFHANIFYPYQYTLAFSEHDYGIALLFFPLFALGLRPLTVHSFATFVGFALSGYGAFRLARTLTKSYGVAWVAGVVFAFVPYRFHLLSHLHYLFAGWMPLLLEALVLFARERGRRRAAWLGVAFLMNALTCISWFILTLAPLALSALFLIVRHRLVRDRAFWIRGAASLALASLLLLPFLLPYYKVSKLYGFKWPPDDAVKHSAHMVDWLAAERRNKLWEGLGDGVPGVQHKLFPGLLPLLLSLAAFLLVSPAARWRRTALDEEEMANSPPKARLIMMLDALAVVSGVVAVVGAGFVGANVARVYGVELFKIATPDRALFVLLAALTLRCSLAYPQLLRRAEGRNLIESVRSERRTEAFWLGAIWALAGFLSSLGMNFVLYRVLYEYVLPYRSLRMPARAAMVCYVGLALLAGLGASSLAQSVHLRRWRVKPLTVYAVLVAALLFELRAAPLQFVRGAVFPDDLTLRLKETPMRGGLVELPAGGGEFPHRYMLRAADHGRPLVNATSSFISPLTWEIYTLTRGGPIPVRFLDVLEDIPASYLVVHQSLLAPERRPEFETFLAQAVASGRLRYIRSYGERDDLYAVVKTEPAARSEAPLPFTVEFREWAAMLRESPVYVLGQFQKWSQTVYRIHKAATGAEPRYADFIADMESIGRGVVMGIEGQDELLESRMREFAGEWLKRRESASAFDGLTDEQYVERLYANAGIAPDEQELAGLASDLKQRAVPRAAALLKVVGNERFIEKENARSLVLLHYFGYLRRNPGEPPDKGMDGFNYWLKELEGHNDPARLAQAFMASGEYKALSERP